MAVHSSVALVHRSATRRKACAGCVKAKRRCDLTLPGCTRCRARNLSCYYVDSDEPGGSNSDRSSSSPTRVTSAGLAELNNDTSYVGSTSSPSSTDTDEFLSLASSVSSMPPSTSAVPFYILSMPEQGKLNNRQISYMVTQFKATIKSFVLESQTTFIHHLLYRDTVSPIYQGILGVCSLYMYKTPLNKDGMFCMLDCKLAALSQASDSLLCKVEDNLLALQALILYQIIRLFDGDTRQRANAERDLELLDSWTLRLQQNHSLVLSTPSQSSYEHWVLVESIRRTTMVSVVLRGLCSVMKVGYCEFLPLLCTLPVSRSGKGWRGERAWREAVRDEELDEVLTYPEFTQEWNKGNVGEVWEYEKLLLVTCRHAVGTGDFQAG